MPNTTAYSFGDVVLVPFTFTDQTASKKRPAVVVNGHSFTYECDGTESRSVFHGSVTPLGGGQEVMMPIFSERPAS